MLENDRLERQYSEILENTFIRENTLDLLSKFALEINNYKDLHLEDLSIFGLGSSWEDGCIEMYTNELENKFYKDFCLNEIFEFGRKFSFLKDLHQLELFLTKTDIEQTVVDKYEEKKELTNFENTKLALFSFLAENKVLPAECEKEFAFLKLKNKNRKSLSLV